VKGFSSQLVQKFTLAFMKRRISGADELPSQQQRRMRRRKIHEKKKQFHIGPNLFAVNRNAVPGFRL
jgi:hypothetical protein